MVSLPFNVTGFFSSNSAAKEWCAAAGTAQSNAMPANASASSFVISDLQWCAPYHRTRSARRAVNGRIWLWCRARVDGGAFLDRGGIIRHRCGVARRWNLVRHGRDLPEVDEHGAAIFLGPVREPRPRHVAVPELPSAVG